jgi:hypoxanthine phosphoribosyltransferase
LSPTSSQTSSTYARFTWLAASRMRGFRPARSGSTTTSMLKDLGGRDVLLVDDVADTGSTLETAVEKILKPRNPRTVRTATLLIKPWSKSKPDYTAASTDAWVVFPWERMETVRAVGRMWAESLGFDRAAAELAEVSRLRPERVSRTLKELI